MEIASDFHITVGCHVSCSPDGRYAVLDSIGGEVSISILLYDDKTGKMRILHSEEWDIPNLELIKRLNRAKEPASMNIYFDILTDRILVLPNCILMAR